MSKFNKMFKGSFIGLAGIVGSLSFINKYKRKPENLPTHHFYSQTAPYILANRGGSVLNLKILNSHLIMQLLII